MARAYAYAAGDGPAPMELQALRAIDRFGAPSIWGRPLGVGEVTRMGAVERIVAAFHARQKSENWAAWAHDNPEANGLLNYAERLGGENA